MYRFMAVADELMTPQEQGDASREEEEGDSDSTEKGSR